MTTINEAGQFIDGVPLLKWGEWRDSTYCGCLAVLLNAAGFFVSYEEVMGLSGVCYQTIMRDDWDPSSQMPQNGMLCEKNVGDALGISVYTLNKGDEIREQAKMSIDSGIPVLLVGGRWAPEWTLACGYAVVNGEARFFGRTYFDCQNDVNPENTIEHQSARVPENEIYTRNHYFYLSGFPGWFPEGLTRFYDRKCEPISPKQALKVSLETCIRMFEQQPSQYNHKFGYDAYDVLIRGFELDEAEYLEKCQNDQYHIGSLLDARHAAYVYLHACSDLLDGENREMLEEAASIYKQMTDNLLGAVPYEETTTVFNTDSSARWDEARRRELTAALKANKELEKQVRIIVMDILIRGDI